MEGFLLHLFQQLNII